MKFDKNLVAPAVLVVVAILVLVLITVFAKDSTASTMPAEPAQSGQY